MNDFDDLIGHIFVRIIRNGNAEVVVFIHLYGNVNRLQQTLFVYTGEDKVCLIKCFRAFGAGADTDCRERMTDTCEKAALLGQCAAVGNNREGVHLQAIIVVEAERFVLNNALIKLEATLLQAL